MMKRLFDIGFSLFFLLLLLPLFILLSIWIATDSGGGPFFLQLRVGHRGRLFSLIKFRTMRTGAELSGQITIGSRDPRITGPGHFLRRFKLDELPQLVNILIGDMSVVGPRPEVPRYVALYTEEQRKVLEVRPGLTDYASLEYFSESELLGKAEDPEHTYIHEVMPAKLSLNLKYISESGLRTDLRIIWRTVKRIFSA